jgi:protein SCO1
LISSKKASPYGGAFLLKDISMKKQNIIGFGILTVAVLVGAYFFSKEVGTIKSKALPYYVFEPKKNVLLETTEPSIRVERFSFIDQGGNVFTEKETEGAIYVADYFFVECPGICKEMGSQLQRVYTAFENEPNVKILSHTSKPEEDSVSVLMAYSNKMGVRNKSKWVFLTGDKKQLYSVARNKYHIVDELGDGGEDDFIHTERFVLVDKKKYIRGYYDGTDSIAVDKIMNDIRILLLE